MHARTLARTQLTKKKGALFHRVGELERMIAQQDELILEQQYLGAGEGSESDMAGEASADTAEVEAMLDGMSSVEDAKTLIRRMYDDNVRAQVSDETRTRAPLSGPDTDHQCITPGADTQPHAAGRA